MSLGTVVKFLYKVLYTLPFVFFGVMHFMQEGFINYVPSYLPFATFWTYATGLCFLAGSLAVLTGRHSALAFKLLGALLMVIVLTVHLPNFAAMMPIPLFTLGLAGASFVLSEKV
ncbi:MAG: hypothetical protein OSA24_05600 [Longimicrobiales bacterium]|nr:hypothetical protein [Longimicrobiales bacterium]